VTTVFLLRHGMTALTDSTLLGWTPGVGLDARGRAQAEALATRVRSIRFDAIVSSPLERCRQTADVISGGRQPPPAFELDDRLGDVRYGDWTGRSFKELNRLPAWRRIHQDASSFRFPNGEALHEMGARSVAAVRDWNERLGPDATYALVSHADPIRAILADALGLAFGAYLRLVVGPASLSVVRYGPTGARVLRVNDQDGDPSELVAMKRRVRAPRTRQADGRAGGPATMS
jgi:probable phosphomutase (TIGR03848 family)